MARLSSGEAKSKHKRSSHSPHPFTGPRSRACDVPAGTAVAVTSINRLAAFLSRHPVAHVEAPDPDTTMRLDLEKDHDPGDDVTKGIDYPTQLKGRLTLLHVMRRWSQESDD
jgi:hypothetical protein